MIDGIAKKDRVPPEDEFKGQQGLKVHPDQLTREMPEILESRVFFGTAGAG